MMTVEKLNEEIFWLRVRIESLELLDPLPVEAARALRSLHENQRAACRELELLQYSAALVRSARDAGAILNPQPAA